VTKLIGLSLRKTRRVSFAPANSNKGGTFSCLGCCIKYLKKIVTKAVSTVMQQFAKPLAQFAGRNVHGVFQFVQFGHFFPVAHVEQEFSAGLPWSWVTVGVSPLSHGRRFKMLSVRP